MLAPAGSAARELLRFWKVSFQTIAAPVLTALLYLLIFSHVLESRVAVFGGQVAYTSFLIPGLVMMSVLHSFASVVVADPVEDHRQPDLRAAAAAVPARHVRGLRAGAMVRGLVVGLGVFVVTLLLAPGPFAIAHPLWALAFAILGSDPRYARRHRRHLGRQVRRLAAFQNF